jgi:DNA-directed RNA polymerase I, II, and III subunit RPABC3
MNLTLDYNVELFPLEVDDVVALALSSSLAREGAPSTGAAGEENERDVWRPDGKGTRGLEDEYDYVMYGKVRLLFNSDFLCLQRLESIDLQI